MHLKLMLVLILIFIISIFGFTYLYEYFGNGTLEIICAVFHLTLVFILYLVSGFFATDKIEIFDLKNYDIVALIS